MDQSWKRGFLKSTAHYSKDNKLIAASESQYEFLKQAEMRYEIDLEDPNRPFKEFCSAGWTKLVKSRSFLDGAWSETDFSYAKSETDSEDKVRYLNKTLTKLETPSVKEQAIQNSYQCNITKKFGNPLENDIIVTSIYGSHPDYKFGLKVGVDIDDPDDNPWTDQITFSNDLFGGPVGVGCWDVFDKDNGKPSIYILCGPGKGVVFEDVVLNGNQLQYTLRDDLDPIIPSDKTGKTAFGDIDNNGKNGRRYL